MPGEESKPRSAGSNPDELTQLLELELMRKRAAWQETAARNRRLKTASILFLFVIVMAALVGFYLAFSRVNEQRSQQHPNATAAPGAP
ncbi:MAG: hypothetical protein QOG67_1396 [Verrucomicrobiota bacterium]|jgi:hypothetical protein